MTVKLLKNSIINDIIVYKNVFKKNATNVASNSRQRKGEKSTNQRCTNNNKITIT